MNENGKCHVICKPALFSLITKMLSLSKTISCQLNCIILTSTCIILIYISLAPCKLIHMLGCLPVWEVTAAVMITLTCCQSHYKLLASSCV